jgi:hypothetical protein
VVEYERPVDAEHAERPRPGRPQRTYAAAAACDGRALFEEERDLAVAEQGGKDRMLLRAKLSSLVLT